VRMLRAVIVPIVALAVVQCLSAAGPAVSGSSGEEVPVVATFSIAGFDPLTGELGIAVASKFLAVGSVVPWARAGVGAIATQAYANTAYGPDGLDLLASGLSAQQAVDSLVKADPGRDQRQVGIVDAQGRSATYTGKGCTAWAGGKAGPNFACQGNILVSQATVDALASTFERTEGDLPTRLLEALKAGDAAGGDSRGRESAALLVVKAGAGYGGFNDRYIDLRMDDDPQPIQELSRILSIQLAYAALSRATALREDGQLDLALREAKAAADLNPNIPEVMYDLACYYALNGMKGPALDALKQALEEAPTFRRMATEDSDLVSLREEPAFKQMVGEKP
jgi:uncharacterized Ntn-hydrolase superfamily protein